MINQVHYGDCRESLRAMAAAGVIVQTCVTSPPYFGLRDYGHAGQIGLEETPERFIAELVEVFRCVRDVLADDGTLWVNIGDTYAAQRGGTTPPAETLAGGKNGKGDANAHRGRKAGYNPTRNASAIGLKHKDLIGIPWMLAFALRADGWYLRQDIIWHKPNPMPESVTDRCTKAHEYVFLLSKGPRYFYDAEGVKEAAVCDRMRGPALHADTKSTNGNGGLSRREPQEHRNRRSVWTIATKPYKGAHFATFPPALIEPCILAGSRPGDVVLDPFMGSGTTAEVAIKHGRQYVGCELNADYAALIDERIAEAGRPTAIKGFRKRAPKHRGQIELFGIAA